MLLVPLGLAAPGAPPEAGDEVVLAAGSPAAAGEEDGAGDTLDEVADDDGGVDEVVLADESEPVDGSAELAEPAGAASPRPPRRSPSSSSAASAERRAATSSSAKRAGAAKAAGGVKPTPTTQATAAEVAAAADTQAPPPPPPSPPPPPAKPAPVSPAVRAADAVWDKLAVCESGNTNNGGAPYYGYWQFSAGTWSSMGEPGLPNDHSREKQLAVAKRLQARSGWGQWPACARKLGLR